MGISLKLGDTVPLYLELGDRASDQYPQAEIYDHLGANLTAVSLSHFGDGLVKAGFRRPIKEEALVGSQDDKDLTEIIMMALGSGIIH